VFQNSELERLCPVDEGFFVFVAVLSIIYRGHFKPPKILSKPKNHTLLLNQISFLTFNFLKLRSQQQLGIIFPRKFRPIQTLDLLMFDVFDEWVERVGEGEGGTKHLLEVE
jgi:hypothetical protein